MTPPRILLKGLFEVRIVHSHICPPQLILEEEIGDIGFPSPYPKTIWVSLPTPVAFCELVDLADVLPPHYDIGQSLWILPALCDDLATPKVLNAPPRARPRLNVEILHGIVDHSLASCHVLTHVLIWPPLDSHHVSKHFR